MCESRLQGHRCWVGPGEPPCSLMHRLLYTTPESIAKPLLMEALKEAALAGTLCSFAVDEAHCVSEW